MTKEKIGPSERLDPIEVPWRCGLVHTALAALSSCASDGLLDGGVLWHLGNSCLGDEDERCNGSCILKRGAGDLDWVKNAHLNHVAVLAGSGVKTLAGWKCLDLLDNYAALEASVVSDGANWSLKCLADDLDADLLVCVRGLNAVKNRGSSQEGNAATCDDALLDSCASCLKCILDAVLDLLELNLGSCANLDDCNAASKLSKTLL